MIETFQGYVHLASIVESHCCHDLATVRSIDHFGRWPESTRPTRAGGDPLSKATCAAVPEPDFIHCSACNQEAQVVSVVDGSVVSNTVGLYRDFGVFNYRISIHLILYVGLGGWVGVAMVHRRALQQIDQSGCESVDIIAWGIATNSERDDEHDGFDDGRQSCRGRGQCRSSCWGRPRYAASSGVIRQDELRRPVRERLIGTGDIVCNAHGESHFTVGPQQMLDTIHVYRDPGCAFPVHLHVKMN